MILPTHTVNQTAYSMKEAMEQAIYEFEFRGAYPYLADFWGANTSGYCLVGWFGSSFILVVDSIRKHRSQGESKASHKEIRMCYLRVLLYSLKSFHFKPVLSLPSVYDPVVCWFSATVAP